MGVLKHMPDHLAKTLLTEYSKGIQSEFYYHWSKWVTTCNTPEQEPAVDMNVKQTPKELTSKALIDLKDILSSGPYGPGVVSQ